MTTWNPDERHRKLFGNNSMVPERGPGGTAHLITFGDGRQIRVLPDDATTGQKRSLVVQEALAVCQALTHGSAALPEDYDVDETVYQVALGVLSYHGLTWTATIASDVTIEEWLTEWLEAGGSAAQLLEDLDIDGWQITRKDAS